MLAPVPDEMVAYDLCGGHSVAPHRQRPECLRRQRSGDRGPGQAGSVTTLRWPRGAASETRTVDEVAMAAQSRPAAAGRLPT